MWSAFLRLPQAALYTWSRRMPERTLVSNTVYQLVRTMKVRSSVKKICLRCELYSVNGRVFCKCPNPKHMQRQFRSKMQKYQTLNHKAHRYRWHSSPQILEMVNHPCCLLICLYIFLGFNDVLFNCFDFRLAILYTHSAIVAEIPTMKMLNSMLV